MYDYDPNYVPQKIYFRVGQKCVVVNSENKVLLLKRSSLSGGGGWSLVGGGLEKEEDPIDSIKREAMEETQIEIYDVKPVKVVSFSEGEDEVVMIAYKARTDQNNITLNWEHEEYKWVSNEEALKEDLSETIKDFIKLAA